MSDATRSGAPPSARPPGFGSTDIPPTPRVVRPRVIAMLWLGVVALLSSGLLAWRVSVPVPIEGLAVGTVDPGPRVLVALPARARAHVEVGARVVSDAGWEGTVERIELASADLQPRAGAISMSVIGRHPCWVWVELDPLATQAISLPLGHTIAVQAWVERTALSLWWDDTTNALPRHQKEAP